MAAVRNATRHRAELLPILDRELPTALASDLQLDQAMDHQAHGENGGTPQQHLVSGSNDAQLGQVGGRAWWRNHSWPVRRPPAAEGAAGKPAADPAAEARLPPAARSWLRPALVAGEPVAPPPTLRAHRNVVNTTG